MVQYKCGRHYIERNKKNKQEFKGFLPGTHCGLNKITISNIELYSSYIGKVPISTRYENDNIYLETIYTTKQNRNIYIKILDLLENNLYDSYIYPLDQLMNLKAVCINKNENIYKYAVTLLCYININKMENSSDNVLKYTKLFNEINNQEISNRLSVEYPELMYDTNLLSTKYYKKILQKALEYNSRIDIMFAALEYLDFINTITNGQIDTINNQNILIFISGVPKLDNAYWNGSYMIFGNGDNLFYPLTSIDVIGHELTHGLIQGVCDLIYQGHSGALNESYADIFGTMLEFFIYNKYPNKLFGKEDWLIGEDVMIDSICLRNMKNPHLSEQPSRMYDEYYIDPTSMIDYGGVHINSGIPNYCFYLISQNINKYKALQIFIECLYKLVRYSNFYSFSETLLSISRDEYIYNALYKVGLSSYVNQYPILIEYPNNSPLITKINTDEIPSPTEISSNNSDNDKQEPNSNNTGSILNKQDSNISNIKNDSINEKNINSIDISKLYIQQSLSIIYIPVLSYNSENDNVISLIPYKLSKDD
jgi:hypothetical protein